MAESWFALCTGEQAEALEVAYAYIQRVVESTWRNKAPLKRVPRTYGLMTLLHDWQ
jgi:hypothetical protein